MRVYASICVYAEDIYQETLHRLAARWSRVAHPMAFCRRVMHNIVIDWARAQQRRPRELELRDNYDGKDPRSGDPVSAAEHATDDLHAPSAITAGIVTRQHRRHRNSRILGITVTSVAAAAVVAAVVVTRAGPSAPSHAQHPTALHPTALPAIKLTAVQVLDRLSVAAASAPQQTGRYIALTEIRQEPAATYPKDFKSELNNKKLSPMFRARLQQLVKEYGYPARIVTTDRTSVFDSLTGDIWTRQHGSNVPSELPVATHGSPTRAQFAAWPTNPAALRAVLLQQGQQSVAQGEQVQGETPDDLVFQEATNWLWNPLLSPALRAAMYKVLAATPGVAVKTGITDKTGRPSRSAGTTASPANNPQPSKAPARAPCSSRPSAMPAPTYTRRSPAMPPFPPTPTAAAEATADGPALVIRPAAGSCTPRPWPAVRVLNP
jgi:DNA-directed RNA polymerase specialized sigma24 family protein